jgi:hypothetical protein
MITIRVLYLIYKNLLPSNIVDELRLGLTASETTAFLLIRENAESSQVACGGYNIMGEVSLE